MQSEVHVLSEQTQTQGFLGVKVWLVQFEALAQDSALRSGRLAQAPAHGRRGGAGAGERVSRAGQGNARTAAKARLKSSALRPTPIFTPPRAALPRDGVQACSPTRTDYDARLSVIAAVKHALQELVYASKDVQPYGSFVSGFYKSSRWDGRAGCATGLDMC